MRALHRGIDGIAEWVEEGGFEQTAVQSGHHARLRGLAERAVSTLARHGAEVEDEFECNAAQLVGRNQVCSGGLVHDKADGGPVEDDGRCTAEQREPRRGRHDQVVDVVGEGEKLKVAGGDDGLMGLQPDAGPFARLVPRLDERCPALR